MLHCVPVEFQILPCNFSGYFVLLLLFAFKFSNIVFDLLNSVSLFIFKTLVVLWIIYSGVCSINIFLFLLRFSSFPTKGFD